MLRQLADQGRRARGRPVRAAREPPVGAAGLVALTGDTPDDDLEGAGKLRSDEVLGIGMTASPPETRMRSTVGRHRRYICALMRIKPCDLSFRTLARSPPVRGP